MSYPGWHVVPGPKLIMECNAIQSNQTWEPWSNILEHRDILCMCVKDRLTGGMYACAHETVCHAVCYEWLVKMIQIKKRIWLTNSVSLIYMSERRLHFRLPACLELYLRVPSKRVAIVSRKVFWGASKPLITGILDRVDPFLSRRDESLVSEGRTNPGKNLEVPGAPPNPCRSAPIREPRDSTLRLW